MSWFEETLTRASFAIVVQQKSLRTPALKRSNRIQAYPFTLAIVDSTFINIFLKNKPTHNLKTIKTRQTTLIFLDYHGKTEAMCLYP